MRTRRFVQLVVVVFVLSLVPLLNGCSEDATTSPQQTSIQDTSPPAPPVGIEVQTRESGIILNWSPNVEPDLVGYNVYLYQPDPRRNESYVKYNTELLTANQYRRSKLPAAPEHVFRLTAVDEAGNESAFSSMIVASVPIQAKEL